MKTINTVLTTLAILVIVALSAFNTHRVGEQAKEIAELQQFHTCETADTFCPIDPLWESIDEVIEYRKGEINWENTLDVWRNIPEESLRHILKTNGINLSIQQMVEIYTINNDFYEAFEEGYNAYDPDTIPRSITPDLGISPSMLLE